jgi:restriction system protein
MALLGDEDVRPFVSIGGFTKDAQDEARTQEERRITLLDLERLFDLGSSTRRSLMTRPKGGCR